MSTIVTALFMLLSLAFSEKGDSKEMYSLNGFLKDNYILSFNEDFSSDELDLNTFNIELRDAGWVNNELQTYTDRKENLSVTEGILKIKAIKEEYNKAEFTSSRITTQGKRNWRHGRFEVSAKLPAVQGTWPAIWLLSESISTEPWPKCGEIDIMEHINKDNKVYGTVHTDKYNHMHGNQLGGEIDIASIDKNFNTYGIEWNSSSIVWFVNNQIFYRIDRDAKFEDGEWPFDKKYFLILNMAIGGFWPGDPDENFKEADFLIDWIRVYE